MKHLIAKLSLSLLVGCGEEVRSLAKPPEAVSASRHLKYEVEGDTVAITGCHKKASGSLIIPRTIEGKLVAKIQRLAFSDCNRLTKVTIPDSVTSIGEYSFVDCSSITSITIPDSVDSIGWGAFRNCSSLTAITFLGDSPNIVNEAFTFRESSPTIYRKSETKGWDDTLAGRPIKLVTEKRNEVSLTPEP